MVWLAKLILYHLWSFYTFLFVMDLVHGHRVCHVCSLLGFAVFFGMPTQSYNSTTLELRISQQMTMPMQRRGGMPFKNTRSLPNSLHCYQNVSCLMCAILEIKHIIILVCILHSRNNHPCLGSIICGNYLWTLHLTLWFVALDILIHLMLITSLCLMYALKLFC